MSDPAPAPRLPFPPGTVVEEKYCIENFLGQGEMGCVYLATHLRTKESLALKLVHPVDPTRGPAAFASVLVAARAAARFRSENVCHVRDMGLLEDGNPFLVMEFLGGETLQAYLRAQPVLLPIGRAVDLALQAARGLGDAHSAGVIHRNAKPSNWFLARTSERSVRVKMLDFGGATILPRPGSGEDTRCEVHYEVGTPPYAAPEQARFPSEVDLRADIWTVGVVLYELLAGGPPFRGDTVRQARDRALCATPQSLVATRTGISAELEAVVMRCLEKSPEARFETMEELTLALTPFQGGGARSSVRPPVVAMMDANRSVSSAPLLAASPEPPPVAMSLMGEPPALDAPAPAPDVAGVVDVHARMSAVPLADVWYVPRKPRPSQGSPAPRGPVRTLMAWPWGLHALPRIVAAGVVLGAMATGAMAWSVKPHGPTVVASPNCSDVIDQASATSRPTSPPEPFAAPLAHESVTGATGGAEVLEPEPGPAASAMPLPDLLGPEPTAAIMAMSAMSKRDLLAPEPSAAALAIRGPVLSKASGPASHATSNPPVARAAPVRSPAATAPVSTVGFGDRE